MTQCFLCCNFKKTILIRYSEGKEDVFCILHMLRKHTGLQKLSNTNVYDLRLLKMNQLDISKPCINIAKNYVLFEQYRMALNRKIYNNEV